jgi:hypothetical protein
MEILIISFLIKKNSLLNQVMLLVSYFGFQKHYLRLKS